MKATGRSTLLATIGLLASLAPSAASAGQGADTRPPRIVHSPVAQAPPGAALAISATITDESGVFAPTLYFRASGSRKYLKTPMTRKAASTFVGSIPAEAMKGSVEYFIEAFDSVGNGPSRFPSPENPAVVEAVVPAPPPPVVEAPKPPPALAVPPLPPQEVKATSSGKGMRIAGWSLLGVGALGAAGSAAFWLRASSLDNEGNKAAQARDGEVLHQRASSSRTVATGVAVAGGVAVVAGAVLLLAAPSSSPEQPGPTTAALSILPGGAALSVGGRF